MSKVERPALAGKRVFSVASWCPEKLVHAFLGSDIMDRCGRHHVPRIAVVDGVAWVCACARNPKCKRPTCSSVYRLGPTRLLPKRSPLPPTGTAMPSAIRDTLAGAVPLPDTMRASDFLNVVDLRINEGLGVHAWRWIRVGKTPGLVGVVKGEPVSIVSIQTNALRRFNAGVAPVKP